MSTRVNAKAVRSAVLAISCLAIFGSAILIPFPGISQLTAKMGQTNREILQALAEGTSLFMGMTSHSQVMGPLVGIISTMIFGDLLFAVKKWDKLYVALLLIAPILLIKTSSRTAMGTYLAGMGMVYMVFLHSRGMSANWRGKVIMACSSVIVLSFVALIVLPQGRNAVLRYALKAQGSQTVKKGDFSIERFTNSRQGLVDESMFNFRKKPFLGNGFQVNTETALVKRSKFVDYLSAPIEKGVWIPAVLEEGGVPGLILFGGFLLVCFMLLVKRHAYIGACMLWVFTIANLGEFCFFSMSYIGGLYWGLVFAGLVLDGQRMKNVGLQVFEVPIEVVMEEVGIDKWTKRLA